jgi:hypothetical protein
MSIIKEKISLELSKNEALVFFQWLSNFNKKENVFFDQAEQRVLWDIEAMLESNLAEPFDSNYDILLAKAYDMLRDSGE